MASIDIREAGISISNVFFSPALNFDHLTFAIYVKIELNFLFMFIRVPFRQKLSDFVDLGVMTELKYCDCERLSLRLLANLVNLLTHLWECKRFFHVRVENRLAIALNTASGGTQT